jgi:hypothetical protein
MRLQPALEVRQFLSTIGALLVILVLTGCSSFNRDYKRALVGGVPAEGIEGPWVGSWLSDKNGHNGELRGLITRLEGDVYRTRFKARYWKLFTYTSEVEFEMQPHNDGYEFFGAKKLGWLAGGEYIYEGRVNSERFFSTYKNKWDEGTFQMERPSAEE